MKMAYLSYPYTSNPEKNTEDVGKIALKIIEERKDVVLIIPHYAFDVWLGLPKGYEYPWLGRWELEIISRCDFMILGTQDLSTGMVWEKEFAEWRNIPVYSVKQVLDRADEEIEPFRELALAARDKCWNDEIGGEGAEELLKVLEADIAAAKEKLGIE